MVQTREENLQWARLSKRVILEASAALGADPDAPMQLAILIMKLQKEITNRTMRSQSKCQIQKRLNTATIGEPTERGMQY
jgi:hypothetical protein